MLVVDFTQLVVKKLASAKLVFVFLRKGLKIFSCCFQSTFQQNPRSKRNKEITKTIRSNRIGLSRIPIGSYQKRLSLFSGDDSIPKNYLSVNTFGNLSNPNKEIPTNQENHIQPRKLKEVISINSIP